MSEEKSAIRLDHEERDGKGAFFVARDEGRLAELTYTRVDAKTVIIDHTEVSEVLRGQGIARKLLDRVVRWGRETGTRFMVTCPYAKAQFDKDASIRDVLVA